MRIDVCSDANLSVADCRDALVHEMVHSFDKQRVLDFDANNCAHRMCTEVRATALSGECDFGKELFRGQISISRGIRKHHQHCIRRKVQAALDGGHCAEYFRSLPNTYFDACLSDTSPFIDAPFL